MSKNSKFSRREFLNISALGAAGIVTASVFDSSKLMAMQPGALSTVIQIIDDNASKVEGSTKKFPVNQTIAQKMVDEGIKKLTGIEDIGEAWKNIFPGITKDKKISIKINCIASGFSSTGLSSHPEVAYSIVNGLKQMVFDGSKYTEENITIWDRWDREMIGAGYALNKTAVGFKCQGGGNNQTDYSNQNFDVSGNQEQVSNILMEQTDYLINLSVLKDHAFAGITMSLKNHYGSISSPGSLHNNNCDPFVPALNLLEPIKSKQMICICDAIYGIISGGGAGSPQVTPNILLFSKDTVALDTIGGQLLIDNGMNKSKRTMAHYLDTAANATYNLGTNDISQIDHIKIDITNTEGTVGINQPQDLDNLKIFSNYPNPFKEETTLSHQLFKADNVNIKIFDLKGSLVKNIVNQHQPEGYHQSKWNGQNMNGIDVPKGVYLAMFNIGGVNHTIKIVKN